jgi:hypothetical protein
VVIGLSFALIRTTSVLDFLSATFSPNLSVTDAMRQTGHFRERGIRKNSEGSK